MKKIIYFTVLLFLVLIPKDIVKANCDDSEIVKLQKIANNVNISYTFDEKKKTFDIFISNLKKDIELKDIYNDRIYNSNNEVHIENFNSGRYIFKLYPKNKECSEYEITSKTISIPFYNSYYEKEDCKGFENNYYCLKWLKSDVDYNEWKANVSKYEKEEVVEKETVNNTTVYKLYRKVQEFYSKYYFIILPIIIISLLIAIYVNNKKNSLV